MRRPEGSLPSEELLGVAFRARPAPPGPQEPLAVPWAEMRKLRPREEGWVQVSRGAGQGHLGLASGSTACTKPCLAGQGPWGVFLPFRSCPVVEGWVRPSPRTHLRPGLCRPVSEARRPGLQALTWRLRCASAFRPPSRLAPHILVRPHGFPLAPEPGPPVPSSMCPGLHPRSPGLPARPPPRGVRGPSTGHYMAPGIRPGGRTSSMSQHQPMKDSQATSFTGGRWHLHLWHIHREVRKHTGRGSSASAPHSAPLRPQPAMRSAAPRPTGSRSAATESPPALSWSAFSQTGRERDAPARTHERQGREWPRLPLASWELA